MNAWLYLGIAALFEVVFAVSMKASDGFTRPVPTAVTLLGVLGGIVFLTLAMKTLPVGVAYPIWTAVGTLGTVLIGFLVFGESLTVFKGFGLLAILIGVASLHTNA